MTLGVELPKSVVSSRFAFLIILAVVATAGRFAISEKLGAPGGWVYSDMLNYQRVAEHLLDGQFDRGDSFVPVGYPLFLATVYSVFGQHLTVVSAIQAAFGGLTVLIAGLIAR